MKSSFKTRFKLSPRYSLMTLSILGLGMPSLMMLKEKFISKHEKSPQFHEAVVSSQNLKVKILCTGTVQPENRLEIKSPVSGRIEKVLVREGQLVKKGDVLLEMSSSERAALLDAARAEGPKELKKWESYYKAAPILAPLDGMIISRDIEPGQSAASSDELLVMSDRLSVKAQVDETDIAKIRLHQKATIVLDAYPTQEITGTVDQIAYEARHYNNVTTYIVDVIPNLTPDFFRAGMTANVSFELNQKENILAIPFEAVRTDNGRTFVLVKKEDSGDVEERSVDLGSTDGIHTEVVNGLKEGERVLINNVDPSKLIKSQSHSNPFSMPSESAGAR